jgi:DNA mismatch repair protein MutS
LLHAGVKNYHVAVQETPDGIAFLRVVLPGSMNRSYGIQVARLAGLPRVVVDRAMQVLDQLSKQGMTPARGKRRGIARAMPGPTEQLSLFDAPGHPIVDQLRSLDITRLTPLDALTTLHRWQEMVRAEKQS